MFRNETTLEDPEVTDPHLPGPGAVVSAGDPSAEGESPQLVLRPVFVPPVCLAAGVPLTLFLSLWCAGFFGGFSQFALESFELGVPSWLPFLLFAVAALVILPWVTYRAQKRSYERTEYRFFGDRIELNRGLFHSEEVTIPLQQVTEVRLERRGLQLKHGLGTLLLSTPETVHNARAGIRIHDVADVDRVFEEVKGLVDDASRPRTHHMAA